MYSNMVWTILQRVCIVCRWKTFTVADDNGMLVGLCADKTCREKIVREV